MENKRLTKQDLTDTLHSQIKFDRQWTDIVADYLTKTFGTVSFFIINALFFVAWLVLNIPQLGFKPFDPFPYGFLTLIVSLEAIFLSIIVLISQNRQSKISDIRQQVEFEINVRAEEEATKTLKLLHELHEHLGIQSTPDQELEQMERQTDIEKIKKTVEEETKDA